MALPSYANLATNFHTFNDLEHTAQVVGSGAKTLFSLEIDNSGNTSAVYFKAWNNASPTVGTTAPDLVEKIPAGESRTIFFNGRTGIAFGTALSVAIVTTAGTAGTTGPTNSVPVTIGTN